MTGSPQEESWACQPHLGVGPSGPKTRIGGLPSRVRLRGFPGGGGCRASEPRPGPSHLASDAHSPPRLPSAAPGSATTQTQRLAESGRAVPAAGGRRLLPGGCRPCAPCPSAPARRAPRRKPNLRVFVTGSGRDWTWTSVFQAASSSSVCGVVNH